MQQPDKALDNKLTIKRKRIMSYFIEAAEKLIRTEGWPVHPQDRRRGGL